MIRAREQNVLNSVLLELTYSCNLDCTFCYNDLNLRGRRVSLDRYKALLEELADMGVMSLTLSGGEPLLYQHFFALGAYAKKQGFVIKVKSNGIPLNLANARRLRHEVDPFIVETSLHGARPESHDRLTQVAGSFERLIRNIGILKEQGLRVKVNSCLTRWNEGQVQEMFELADRLDVPLQFDPEVTPRDDGDLSPLDISPSREGVENMVRLSMQRSRAMNGGADRLPIQLKMENAPASKQGRGKNKVCGAGSTNLIVDPFGNVFPCVQFRRKVGNIHEQSAGEIWNSSSALNEVRELAGRALEVARAGGLKQFCMGVNELRMGDPLAPPESKKEIDRIYQRVHWELQQNKKPDPNPTN
jgi:radical SAM protein with 4Fe4S-binding SPASM domain